MANKEDLEPVSDIVNHPSHYETGKFECFDVMLETQGIEEVCAYCICAAQKYIYRHKRKNGLEDIKKAKWYIDKYIELMEKQQVDFDHILTDDERKLLAARREPNTAYNEEGIGSINPLEADTE